MIDLSTILDLANKWRFIKKGRSSANHPSIEVRIRLNLQPGAKVGEHETMISDQGENSWKVMGDDLDDLANDIKKIHLAALAAKGEQGE